jgi:hypothetical protein
MDPSSEAPHIDTSVGDMPSPSDYSEGMVDSPTMAEMGDSLKLFVGQVSLVIQLLAVIELRSHGPHFRV